MNQLIIKNTKKTYGRVTALNGTSFTVKRGELLAILGPSGCGKSTLLACIAGIETPDSGVIELNGNLLNDPENGLYEPPESRNIGMVFQNYALWPHMTVEKNLAFPLKMHKRNRAFIRQEVNRILELVRLREKGSRYPGQLSGGEQQRVALGRALIMNPDLLLLDEPLSNLDARLREEMQEEIRTIQKALDLTIIHVTHDQTEAMAMSDRIILMNEGQIIQSGSPTRIYGHPESAFAAEFMGVKNILKGRIVENGDSISFCSDKRMKLNIPESAGFPNEQVLCIIRPENISLAKGNGSEGLQKGTIVSRLYKGNHYLYTVKAEDITLKVQTHTSDDFKQDEGIGFKINSCTFIKDS